MCIRSDRYDQEVTLLHFDNAGAAFDAEAAAEDALDLFRARSS